MKSKIKIDKTKLKHKSWDSTLDMLYSNDNAFINSQPMNDYIGDVMWHVIDDISLVVSDAMVSVGNIPIHKQNLVIDIINDYVGNTYV